jgi:pyruvate/2-oxoglutarate dehydrogenase complex dihydrolipoamide acyltransferase (E2) component
MLTQNSFLIFCPGGVGEQQIDVSIVMQLIAPILKQRREDGTWIFDLFAGVNQKKMREAGELIMFCVDCSQSMGGQSDFEEHKEEDQSSSGSDDDDAPPQVPSETPLTRRIAREAPLTLNKMKGKWPRGNSQAHVGSPET